MQGADQRRRSRIASFGRASFLGNPQSSRPPAIGAYVVEIHRVHIDARVFAFV